MIIELHSLTSHSPANLNRDDLGRPKSAVFGGVNRARISSQAIKRSVRTSNYALENLREAISTRSRQIPQMIYKQLLPEFSGDKAKRLEELCLALPGAFGKVDSKKAMHTSQIIFLTPDEIARTTDYVRNIVNSDTNLSKSKIADVIDNMAAAIGLNRNPGDGVDMALFGRMTTDDANAFVSVDAAMQVAHAISTHAVTPETDWFTAVDDVASNSDERGSGHIGELEFNSATFYKYFSCNLPLLIRNMNGATEDAVDALATVLDAACRVAPSGKQNSYASHACADTVLLVIRQQRIPVSLANAFERPVLKDENTGYLAPSRIRMLRHYRDLVESYSLEDRTICFCSDSEAREELMKLLPDNTQVVRSLKELFDVMWTMVMGSPITPPAPPARRVERSSAGTGVSYASVVQQTSIPSPSASSSEVSATPPVNSSNQPILQKPETVSEMETEPERLFDNQPTELPSEPNGMPVKRGRGRPPKDPNAPPKPEASNDPDAPKRGRGRPPKDPNAPPKPEASNDPDAPRRGRGRPPKDPNAPPKPEASNDPDAPKRGRGRPPKDPNAPPKPEVDPNTPKRGRGRPRKDVQTSSITTIDGMVEVFAPPLPATGTAEPNPQPTNPADRNLTDGGSL